MLRALKMSYLQLMGSSSQDEKQQETCTKYLKEQAMLPDFMSKTIDDIGAMDDPAFSQWLNSLDTSVKYLLENVLDSKDVIKLQRNGQTERMFVIKVECLDCSP